MAANKAISYLKSIEYPAPYLDEIHHAIVTHSCSANITQKPWKHRLFKDANRLDSLGAIGIARCLYVGQSFNAKAL